MKRCPECRRDYFDDSLLYCLDDGSALVDGPALADEPPTAILHGTSPHLEAGTRAQIHTTEQASAIPPTAGGSPPVSRGVDKRLLVVPLVIALIGSAVFLGYRYLAPERQISSIAVLPLQNVSGDPDSEYLSDGLAESLIYRLSQLPNLKVSSATSVMRYKGKEIDLQKIAAELGVQALMSGRLIQRGDNLTIRVELIDVANNKTLWGEQYERKMSDLLATQREIATAIAEKLQLKLSGEDAKGLTKKYTESNNAYQLYLKGRFQWNKRTGESLKQAAVFYQQAIEQDPGFALAYSGLAETYVLFSNYDVASSLDSMPQAKAAALRALELDESLAEAHTALGWYFIVFEFNWAGAERSLRRAIELNSNYATAHQWLGELLIYTKRFDEGIDQIKRAQELDPLSPVIASTVGWAHLYARRYDESIAATHRAIGLHPNFGVAYSNLCLAYNAKGMKETIAVCRKALEMHNDAYNRGFLAFVLGRNGQRDEARKLLDELRAESAKRYVPSFAIAIGHLGLNEKDEALVWLDKEVTERGSWATTLAVAPELDDLRSDPRFKAMLNRLNLPE